MPGRIALSASDDLHSAISGLAERLLTAPARSVLWQATGLASTSHYMRSVRSQRLSHAAGSHKGADMTHVPYRMPQTESRVNDFVVGVLFASVLALSAIISVVQFAYY
jgi:hypothetical protein